jgi:hypothetical protein
MLVLSVTMFILILVPSSCVGVVDGVWWCVIGVVGLDCDDVGCAGDAVYLYI